MHFRVSSEGTGKGGVCGAGGHSPVRRCWWAGAGRAGQEEVWGGESRPQPRAATARAWDRRPLQGMHAARAVGLWVVLCLGLSSSSPCEALKGPVGWGGGL